MRKMVILVPVRLFNGSENPHYSFHAFLLKTAVTLFTYNMAAVTMY